MRSSLLLVFAALATAPGCYVGPAPSSNSDGTITIDNASTHVIAEVRVAAIDNSNWGPNLLGGFLYPNDQLTILVACDTYDVLVSDDRARDCTLSHVDLCFSDSIWTVDNNTLRNCAF